MKTKKVATARRTPKELGFTEKAVPWERRLGEKKRDAVYVWASEKTLRKREKVTYQKKNALGRKKKDVAAGGKNLAHYNIEAQVREKKFTLFLIAAGPTGEGFIRKKIILNG